MVTLLDYKFKQWAKFREETSVKRCLKLPGAVGLAWDLYKSPKTAQGPWVAQTKSYVYTAKCASAVWRWNRNAQPCKIP